MNRPRVVVSVSAVPRGVAKVPVQLFIAVGAAAGSALLGHLLDFNRPPKLDRRIRRAAQAPTLGVARKVLAPLFPLGLPGGYITIGYGTAHWLRRRGRSGGPAVVTAAWLGWLVHRAVKLGYRRERPPRPGVRRRTDSYPSGHTTGATELALKLEDVLSRDR